MKKFLHSDWLRAVQFLGNTVPKKEFSAKKRNSVQISYGLMSNTAAIGVRWRNPSDNFYRWIQWTDMF